MANTPGDYHRWAEAWAVDSVRIYYLETNKVYAAGQLMRAGVRLAQLLDSIKWQTFAEP